MYQYVRGGGESIFYNPKHNYSKDYFTTVARSNGTIGFLGSTTANTLSYSKDNGATWSNPMQNPSVTVNAGDKVLWMGTCTPILNGIGSFTYGTATFDVEGNVMSLIYGDGFNGKTSLEGKNNAFRTLFHTMTKLISAENLSLPATTLASSCYNSMFSYCTSLTTAPKLPATTLDYGCYRSMFNQCKSLTTSPELPATTLTMDCYLDMFSNCTGLVTAPEMPATTLAERCYAYMFYGCTSLTTSPELPATTLANYCYQNMFQDCTGLVTAPELPATELAVGCYQFMFSNCTKLDEVYIYGSLGSSTFYNSFGSNPNVYIHSSDDCTIANDAFVNNRNTGSLYLNSGTKWVEDNNLLNQFIGWKLYVDGVYIGVIEGGGGDYYY